MSNFDLKSFMINEGLTRVSRDRSKLLNDIQHTDKSGETVHGQELYDILPNNLYHTLSLEKWDLVKKAGYLGFEYRDERDREGSNWLRRKDRTRTWQKPGWGVFFATNPTDTLYWATSSPDIILSVDKRDLKPNLFYYDGDYTFQGDTSEINSEHASVFYANKIPISLVKVYYSC